MGIADGMSRLLTAIRGRSTIEDAIGTDAEWEWGENTKGGKPDKAVRGALVMRAVMVERWIGDGIRNSTTAVARVEEQDEDRLHEGGLMEGRKEMERRKWGKFLFSEMYRRIV